MSTPAFDLVIRGGTVVDGFSEQPSVVDVAVTGSTIVGIGANLARGVVEIDATDRVVTPGFVDIHTHYDGQITWESTLQPSSAHGVTTVVMGNCGVGFAPARPDQHEMLMKLMEGVEDIPEAVMASGVPWQWESFPDYLDFLEGRRADIDFAAQLPHNPLRVYVMGERGAACEPPSAEDLAQMRHLTAQAIRAGAIGVSTTRNLAHRFRDGRHVPSIRTEEGEALALAAGLRDAGSGVYQILCDGTQSADQQMSLLRRISEVAARPVSFSLLQLGDNPGAWRSLLNNLDEANRNAGAIRAQVLPRPVGILMGLDLSLHPFVFHPSFRPLKDLPLADKVSAMRDPALRSRLLEERSEDPNPFFRSLVDDLEWLFELGDPPNYHPARTESIASRALAMGRAPVSVIYDALMESDGNGVLYRPSANREGDRFESAGQSFLHHPHTVVGLGDGGAHYGMICDAAYPTYLLKYWVNHPDPAKRIDLASAVRMLSATPASCVELSDRGRIALGMKADLNVIDMNRLHLHAPRPVRDLPGGGRRLTQRAAGYDATIVSGQLTYSHGAATGALPGRLIRGGRPQPAA